MNHIIITTVPSSRNIKNGIRCSFAEKAFLYGFFFNCFTILRTFCRLPLLVFKTSKTASCRVCVAHRHELTNKELLIISAWFCNSMLSSLSSELSSELRFSGSKHYFKSFTALTMLAPLSVVMHNIWVSLISYSVRTYNNLRFSDVCCFVNSSIPNVQTIIFDPDKYCWLIPKTFRSNFVALSILRQTIRLKTSLFIIFYFLCNLYVCNYEC